MGVFKTAFSVVLLFILLEVAVTPFKEAITHYYSEFFGFFLPGVKITWECTVLDEVFLLTSALIPVLWRSPRRLAKSILKAFIFLQAYNAFRITILYFFPDPFLHEALFRLGGLLAVILAYLFALR